MTMYLSQVTNKAAVNSRGAPLPIRFNFVYTNANGEQRLVVSVGAARKNAVVEWRTSDPKLSIGAKAHGSATVSSFRRWAVNMRKASKDDWDAFEEVQRKRRWHKEERRWVRAYRKAKAKAQ